MANSTSLPNDTKEVFKTCGTCSKTFAFILDRAFDHPFPNAEQALDQLAGGIMHTGHQCGMLWGASLAAGAESYRRHDDPDQAIAVAVTATQCIVDSFLNRTNTVNCREITRCKLDSVFGMAKFMLKTSIKGMNNSLCFNLAEDWAPEAIQSAKEGLAMETITLTRTPLSCASEVAGRMGASEEEAVMVSGFAGGLGLSGHGCGALSAAIWMKTLAWCKENPGKTPPYFNNPEAKKLLKAFREAAGSEMSCSKITERSFESINEHSEFIEGGGCDKLMEALINS